MLKQKGDFSKEMETLEIRLLSLTVTVKNCFCADLCIPIINKVYPWVNLDPYHFAFSKWRMKGLERLWSFIKFWENIRIKLFPNRSIALWIKPGRATIKNFIWLGVPKFKGA